MLNYIIGTAGHVDHGKSSLIKALTGVDPDRLHEEKIRGLTLDLGFAHLQLSSGISCGIVDVPGHEKYLKNMLAGVGGIDYALLVVDAGEGIREQTREHLDILQLMRVKGGNAVITKTDAVEPERVDQVENDLIDFLKNSFLYDSPIVRFSAVTGEGLETLLYTIENRIIRLKPKPLKGAFRIPIDRVFKKPGIGVVVTGSIYQGSIEEGAKVILLPSAYQCRIRQIQVHGERTEKAYAGQRAALNLVGIDFDQIERGDQIVTIGSARATGRMDVSLELLPNAPHSLFNRSEVRLHLGTFNILVRVVLLDKTELQPGEKAYAQLIFEESQTVFAGDRFIIRAPSSIYTLGGGVVLESYPTKHRRFDPHAIKQLQTKESGNPYFVLKSLMSEEPYKIFTQDRLAGVVSLSLQEISTMIQDMQKNGDVMVLTGGKLILASLLESIGNQILEILGDLEEKHPYRAGCKIDEVKINLPKMEEQVLKAVMLHLKQTERIKQKDGLISTFDFIPKMDEVHQTCYEKVKKLLKENSFTPPSKDELYKKTGESKDVIDEVLKLMLFKGEFVLISDKLIFEKKLIERAKRIIGNHILKNGGITPSEAKELLHSTRKYIIPLLEYFDRIYFTKRQDDKRVLFRSYTVDNK